VEYQATAWPWEQLYQPSMSFLFPQKTPTVQCFPDSRISLARAMWALFIYLMRLECEIMIYHDLGLDVDDAFEQLFHTTESSFSVLAVLLELGKLLANGTGGCQIVRPPL